MNPYFYEKLFFLALPPWLPSCFLICQIERLFLADKLLWHIIWPLRNTVNVYRLSHFMTFIGYILTCFAVGLTNCARVMNHENTKNWLSNNVWLLAGSRSFIWIAEKKRLQFYVCLCRKSGNNLSNVHRRCLQM